MIELRITADNQWYLDGYINTDNDDLTLINASLIHPTGEWMHAAVTYKDNLFKTYVNGVEELNGTVTYSSNIVAATAMTSLGARMNQKNWYHGLIKTFKVTRKALSPAEFLTISTNSEKLTFVEKNILFVFPSIADNYINISFDRYFPS